jgi:hypothetical protein
MKNVVAASDLKVLPLRGENSSLCEVNPFELCILDILRCELALDVAVELV